MPSFLNKYLDHNNDNEEDNLKNKNETTASDHTEVSNKKKEEETEVKSISVKSIIPNRYQPRTEFDEDAIDELAQTISEHGLLQPIVVREYEPEKYEIIAGERRFRAVKKLNWGNINAVVNNLTDKETASMALIENLQRENLNPIEEARAYQQIMEINGLTQQELAKQMGKSQSYIANKMRLLKLPEPIVQSIADDKITQRHGRALLSLPKDKQIKAYNKIMAENLNVKETEKLVDSLSGKKKKVTKETDDDSKNLKSRLNSDIRVSVNTIKQAVSLIKDTGVEVSYQENDSDDDYEINIKLKKK